MTYENAMGSELKVGDAIRTWAHPSRARIISLAPYSGSLSSLFTNGAWIASFDVGPSMTIDGGGLYERVV